MNAGCEGSGPAGLPHLTSTQRAKAGIELSRRSANNRAKYVNISYCACANQDR